MPRIARKQPQGVSLGLTPLSYLGVRPTTPPNLQEYKNTDPTTQDYLNFEIGDLWINVIPLTTNPPTFNYRVWMLVNKPAQTGIWIMFASGTGAMQFLIADDGNRAYPIAAGVNIGGVNVFGGTGITTTADNINTLTITSLGPSSYSEGVWTPVLAFGGASVGITYVTRDAYYVQIGRSVFIKAAIFLSSKGVSVGDATITGIPFTIKNDGLLPQRCEWSLGGNITLNVGFDEANMQFIPGTTTINFVEASTGGAVSQFCTDAVFANNSYFGISGFYFKDTP